jgi:hypothetical protein
MLAGYCRIRTAHTNAVCKENAEFLNNKTAGIYSYRCALKNFYESKAAV